MSDIHGCYKEFIKMLEKINFNDKDILYILGDIFDRGPEPMKILDYIIKRENIILLKGNHEKMFTDAFTNNDYILWYYNGGIITHNQIMERQLSEILDIHDYINKMPLIKVVDKYILVHAGLHNYDDNLSLEEFLKQDENTCLWSRDNIGNEKQYKDYTVICGHTPVQTIEKDCNHIIKRCGTLYIDCGCCFGKKAKGMLACIRLDDMVEFYVESNY